MGKVKIKVIGDEAQEEAVKEAEKVKREQKDLRKGKTAKVAGMKGGERTTAVGVSEADIENLLDSVSDKKPEEKVEGKKENTKEKEKKVVSKRHIENKKLTGTPQTQLSKSIELLRKFKSPSFDESVELHINTKEKGISGMVVLPHGTGKKLKIIVADDAVISDIEKGKIDFDVLVSTPQMMPKLAKVAKVLGPRGLMPNPKNGTITTNTDDAVKKLSTGQISFKTESAAPLIHLMVGKMSMEDKKLEQNISTVLSAIGTARIDKVTLKSTMSPAIHIHVKQAAKAA
ncbi:MAG: hypothetical protein ACHQT7_02440 [Candidatus Levyibacteriota bacterium]